MQEIATDSELDEINGRLLSAAQDGAADLALSCARVAADLYKKFARAWPRARALNVTVVGLVALGDTAGACTATRAAVDHGIAEGTMSEALSAVNAAWAAVSASEIPVDHIPSILADRVRLFSHLGEHTEAIETLLLAANIYSDYGAFQSAYRALEDAEKMARESGIARIVADVLSTEAAIAATEGDDDFALKSGAEALRLYGLGHGKPPGSLLLNLATTHMRKGLTREALEQFEAALQQMPPDSANFVATLVNVSVCYRYLDRLQDADQAIVKARTAIGNGEFEPAIFVELELVAAANALAGVIARMRRAKI